MVKITKFKSKNLFGETRKQEEERRKMATRKFMTKTIKKTGDLPDPLVLRRFRRDKFIGTTKSQKNSRRKLLGLSMANKKETEYTAEDPDYEEEYDETEQDTVYEDDYQEVHHYHHYRPSRGWIDFYSPSYYSVGFGYYDPWYYGSGGFGYGGYYGPGYYWDSFYCGPFFTSNPYFYGYGRRNYRSYRGYYGGYYAGYDGGYSYGYANS